MGERGLNARQLKNSILRLAARGELVPQDPNDEPASALLERVRTEKNRLMKEGKIKKGKDESVIYRVPLERDGGVDNLSYAFFERTADGATRDITDELPFEIPESWEWARLRNIADTVLGKTLDKAKNKGEFRLYLRNANVQWGRFALDDLLEMRFEARESERYGIVKGDLIICEGGEEPGRCSVWNDDIEDMRIQKALHRVRPFQKINSEYLQFVFWLYAESGVLSPLFTGSAIKHLPGQSLKKIYIPLPPIMEQSRIVERIKSLIPRIADYNVAEQKLSTLNAAFPDALKKSILHAAARGMLVPQDPDDEPASVLLERVHAKISALVKSGKAKKDKRESVIFRRDNSYYEKLDGIERCIDDEIPFDAPESWVWCRLNSLGQIIGGGTPKTENRDNWENGTVPWLTPADMKFVSGKYVSKGERNITEKGLSSSSARLVPENTIVYSSRDPIGYVAIASNPLSTNQGFKSVVPYEVSIVAYLFYCLIERTPEIQSRASGTTFKEISGTEFGRTLIPLPPLAEQSRIVEKIEKFELIRKRL
jgi:type I restriction enzyme S subunit